MNKSQNRNFILLLILFVAFRVLTLVAYRPGGLILDFSDFYFYRDFAQLSRQGYIAYQNLWSPYPPLFSLLMVKLWEISTLIPPWDYSNLFFSLIFGGTMLLFETGNLVLLYLLALEIGSPIQALKSAGFYALLFVPIYTLTGRFEGLPIFFFLLSLYLLLKNKPYLSALFGGVGFMVKLIPVLLLPIGVKLLPPPAENSRKRLRLPALNIDLNLPRTLAYLSIFAATIIVIALPFYRMNSTLILSPFDISAGRPSWETGWALLEGNFNYGVASLDMRDSQWTPAAGSPSPLPWGWITLAFAAVGAWLYTRKINWRDPKVAIAFSGLTMLLFFLYSKGYSPQWLGWILIFIVLLLPNWRGVIYAVVLNVVNIIEAIVFFSIFPNEHWLLISTISIRTGIIFLLAMEFSLLIWKHLETPVLIRTRRWVLSAGIIALVVGIIPAGAKLGPAYFDSRLETSPYGNSIRWLREQPVKEAILLNDQNTYNWFFPYLRHDHTFYMLDDYADASTSVEAKTNALMTAISAENAAVWVFDADAAIRTPAESALANWLDGRSPAHQADIEGGRLYLYIRK